MPCRARGLCHPIRVTLSALSLALSIVGHPVSSFAQGAKEQCTDAYVSNQRLRKDGKLKRAREQLLICAQESCPEELKADCVRWLNELEQNLPTFVVAAKGKDGNDTVDVAVFVDGEKVVDKLDGRPIPIDPGAHTLRFEHGSAAPVEQQVVIQQGVKNRSVEISFSPRGVGQAASNGTAKPPPVGGAEPEWERPHPVATYVLWSVSLVGFGLFAGFGIKGKNEADKLDTLCGENAPPGMQRTCTDEQISSVRTKLIVADVSLGVGIAAFTVGLGLLLYNRLSPPPETTPSAVRVNVGPTHGGAWGGLAVVF